jgi:hypothetical protein
LKELEVGTAASPAFEFDDGSGTGVFWPTVTKLGFAVNAEERVRLEDNGVNNLLVTGGVGIGESIASVDVFLVREAAGRLVLRHGTNEQRFYLYNSYTDAANWERGSLEWNSNSLFLHSAKSGSGANRDIRIQASDRRFSQHRQRKLPSTGLWGILTWSWPTPFCKRICERRSWPACNGPWRASRISPPAMP